MEQQIIATWAQVGISGVGLAAILWGLFQMQKAGRRRDREIDVMAETLGRQGDVLGQIGQALERQGQALERQGQALEELLRRSA